MPLINKAVGVIAKRLPKMISPEAHRTIDYATAGGFLLMGVLLWKKNKHASLAAMFCGATGAANALVTSFPGRGARILDFETHGKIDAILAGVAAAVPNIFGFADQPEADPFYMQGVVIGAVTGMTDFADSEAQGRESIQPERATRSQRKRKIFGTLGRAESLADDVQIQDLQIDDLQIHDDEEASVHPSRRVA
ncbi:MAG TPA: hypothetical protein VKZ53_21135 [Candidatus Angelobacter sp.]|nr:hypothetical protein [Candidatus Angelobacter sp.]